MADDAQEFAARLAAERQWPVVVTLKHPVEFGSETIASLEFREGDLAVLKGLKIEGIPSVDELVLIASRMCGKPTNAIWKLKPEDSAEVLQLALGFFAASLGAGKMQSQS